jgi:hypothetical protein
MLSAMARTQHLTFSGQFDYISNLQLNKWIQTTQLKKVNDLEQM